jgi:hypothetical protein
MRPSPLRATGVDGRNRALLSPFASKTGRNQPSTTKFIFGLSAWSRGLIQAAPGHGVAYIDWCQQEFGIAAALSRDVTVCAPVHDAVLIESSVEDLPGAIEVTRNAMAQASALVLGGFFLRTDFDQAVHPQRLLKKGGTAMWNKIWANIDPSKLVADLQHQV